MKKYFIPFIAVVALISACGNEDNFLGIDPSSCKGLNFTVLDFVQEEGSRTNITTDAQFTWASGDTLGVFPQNGFQTAFPISAGAGTNTAQFDGADWALRGGAQYAAYFPFQKSMDLEKQNISVNYLGQLQSGNNSTVHLGKYDYIATAFTDVDAVGNATFQFSHLGALVKISLVMPEADSYSKISVSTDAGNFVTTARYGLSNAVPSLTAVSTATSVEMDLSGISTSAPTQSIILYMMMAPTDLSSATLTFSVTGSKSYTGSASGKNMAAGSAYAYSVTCEAPASGIMGVATPDYDYNIVLVYGQSFANGGGYCGNEDDVPNCLKLGIYIRSNFDEGIVNLRQLNSGHNDAQIAAQCTNDLALLCGEKNKFIAMAGGMGETTIEEIEKGTQYYDNVIGRFNRIKEIADSENKTVGCVAVVWVQGESSYYGGHDGTGTTDKDEYKYLLNRFKENIQQDCVEIFGQRKPLFVVYQTGANWIRNKELSITTAQRELALEMDDVLLGCPSYPVSMEGNNHPNGDGYAHIGELMAKHIYNTIVRKDWYEGCHVKSVEVVDNIIFVHCHVPVPPLRINTYHCNPSLATVGPFVKNYGFSVYVDGVKYEKITNISTVGNCVRIELEDYVNEKIVEVQYAGEDNLGFGQICDSDDRYMSNQVYCGRDNSTTRHMNTPTDEYGRSLIGAHIPLQNWLGNFYRLSNLQFKNHLVNAKIGDPSIKMPLFNNTGIAVTYETSNDEIVEVDENGNLSFNSPGHAKVTAKISKNGIEFKDSYLVIVK